MDNYTFEKFYKGRALVLTNENLSVLKPLSLSEKERGWFSLLYKNSFRPWIDGHSPKESTFVDWQTREDAILASAREVAETPILLIPLSYSPIPVPTPHVIPTICYFGAKAVKPKALVEVLVGENVFFLLDPVFDFIYNTGRVCFLSTLLTGERIPNNAFAEVVGSEMRRLIAESKSVT